MLVGLLIALLAIDALLLIFIILVQKGKGNMGLGSLGGSTQMLFGGSGGQDLFQKITWILGTIFMAGSLTLSIMWSKSAGKSISISQPLPTRSMPVQQPSAPAQQSAPTAPTTVPEKPAS